MAHYEFNKDVLEGEAGERSITDWLCSKLDGELLSDNKTNSHDVIVRFPIREGRWSGDVSFEIKTDVLVKPERDTGNMFIEYYSRGKDSGVTVCKARYFVTYFKHLGEVWVIETDELRRLVQQHSFRQITNAGDRNSGTCGYLIPRMQYRSHFKRYKITT